MSLQDYKNKVANEKVNQHHRRASMDFTTNQSNMNSTNRASHIGPGITQASDITGRRLTIASYSMKQAKKKPTRDRIIFTSLCNSQMGDRSPHFDMVDNNIFSDAKEMN